MDIHISSEFKDICSDIVLGCICCQVKTEKFNSKMWEEIEFLSNDIFDKFKIDKIKEIAQIKSTREVYKKIGNDPNRYRVSSEALLRRILQGKKLYQVNNIVDINNFVSLKYFYSVGSYDLDKLSLPITFRIGQKGESYKGIGKEEVNIENVPVLVDTIGTFGSPTSDSSRAMITLETTNILMIIYSFSGEESVSEALNYAEELLKKYSEGTQLETLVVKYEK